MVIYLDKSIGEHFESCGFDENESRLFVELAVAHQRGNCLLSGDLNSLEILTNNLGGFPSDIYCKIQEHFPEMRSIINEVEFLFVISYLDIPTLPDFIVEKSKILKVTDAINFKINDKCTFLCENLNDNKFYRLMAEKYFCSREIRGIELAFHDEMGGGNTINTVFKKCVLEDQAFTFCIVDNDIKYGKTKLFPNEPAVGDTSNLLSKTFNKLQNINKLPTYELFCLPIHEIENLIPIHVIAQISESKVPEMKIGVNFLKKLLDSGLGQVILFYDFKNGIKKLKDGPHKTYWTEIANKMGDNTFPQINSKLLNFTFDYFDDLLKKDQKFIISIKLEEHLIDLWNEIGLKVFSWGCANKPIRA